MTSPSKNWVAQCVLALPAGFVKVTVLFTGTRSQTADYTSDAQALANEQAADSAAKQAALLLADTLRLEIYAALSK